MRGATDLPSRWSRRAPEPEGIGNRMSYLALARRERPQRFEDVVGQEHIVRTLQNAILNDRVHHAYLFCGTRGVGKTSTARILAKALNCEQGPAAEPCNACRACTEITEGGSVDVIEIDAATHRGVEEAQRFLDGVQYRPAKDRFKFYIVDEVHMMTRHAFNALLKTFEEPPGHVKFVLATTEAHQVPGTILSRCQRFDFRELAPATIEKRLAQIVEQEGIGVSQRALGWVVREARGSMRDAQSLLDQVLAFASGAEISDEEVSQVLGRVDSQHVEAAVAALASRDPGAALETVSEVAARGHDLKAFLSALLDALRAAMVSKACPADAGGDARAALTAEEAEAHAKILAGASVEDVVRWIDQLLRCQSDLQRAEDPRLTLEAAIVRAATLAPVTAVREPAGRGPQPGRGRRGRGGTGAGAARSRYVEPRCVRARHGGLAAARAPSACRARRRARRAPETRCEAEKGRPEARPRSGVSAAPRRRPGAGAGHPRRRGRAHPGHGGRRVAARRPLPAPRPGDRERRSGARAGEGQRRAAGAARARGTGDDRGGRARGAGRQRAGRGRGWRRRPEDTSERAAARNEPRKAGRQLRSDVLSDPVTKEALELWPGAEITEVRSLDGGPDRDTDDPGDKR